MVNSSSFCIEYGVNHFCVRDLWQETRESDSICTGKPQVYPIWPSNAISKKEMSPKRNHLTVAPGPFLRDST